MKISETVLLLHNGAVLLDAIMLACVASIQHLSCFCSNYLTSVMYQIIEFNLLQSIINAQIFRDSHKLSIISLHCQVILRVTIVSYDSASRLKKHFCRKVEPYRKQNELKDIEAAS